MPRKGPLNAGWFRKGFDARRHILTTEERRRGGFAMLRRWYFGYYTYQLQRTDCTAGGPILSYDAWLAGEGDRPGRPRAAASSY